MAEAPFDVAKAHRWFAVEFNNLAWDLLESPERDSESLTRALDAAHAARLHWSHVGEPINALRAEVLLATVSAAISDSLGSLRHAARSLLVCEQSPANLTDFDQATVWGCLAEANFLAGDKTASRDFHAKAMQFADRIPVTDQQLFLKLYPPRK